MKKIAISTTTFGEYDNFPLELCKKHGFEVILNHHGRNVKPGELVELAKDAIGLIAGTEDISEGELLKLPCLKVISRCGAGLENVDLNAANRLNIKVFNTPQAPTLAVAELTVGLSLNLLRKISEIDRQVHSGQWQKKMGSLLSGKKIGIIGFGRIGRKVAELLKPFNCEIAYTDPFVAKRAAGFVCLSKEELLQWADIVSIHAATKDRIIEDKELRLMKKGAWLINVSRGEVLDEKALFSVLKEGHLSAAALDVFEQEPYAGPLLGLDNIILTSHIGSYAKEARIDMEKEAVRNLLKGLEELE